MLLRRVSILLTAGALLMPSVSSAKPKPKGRVPHAVINKSVPAPTPISISAAGTPAPSESVRKSAALLKGHGYSFVVADKGRGWAYLFNASGAELGRSRCITGKTVADVVTKGATPVNVYNLTWQKPSEGYPYTMAVFNGGELPGYPQLASSVYGIHSPNCGFLSDGAIAARTARLKSRGSSGPLVGSSGCVNVSGTFADAAKRVGARKMVIIPHEGRIPFLTALDKRY